MALKCICNQSSFSPSLHSNPSSLIFCPACDSYQHIICITPCEKMKTYICPQCQFQKSDFHLNLHQQILAPSLFIPKTEHKTEHTFSFQINFQFFPSKKGRFYYLLIIRCLKLTDKGYSLEWPKHSSMKINKIPLKGNELLTKRPFMFSITEHQNDKLKKHYHYRLIKDFFIDKVNNVLTLETNVHNNETKTLHPNTYVLSIEYVSVDINVDKIKQNIPKINNKSDICAMLSKGNSMLLNETVELMDIFYTMVGYIGIPARGIDCAHFTCFDLDKFLNLARTSKSNVKYYCPICKQPCNMLYIDEVMKEFIAKGKEMKKRKVVLDNNMDVIEYVEDNNEGNVVDGKLEDDEQEDEFDEEALMNEFNGVYGNENSNCGNYLDKMLLKNSEREVCVIKEIFGKCIRNVDFTYGKEINELINSITFQMSNVNQLNGNNNNTNNSNSSPTSSSSIININTN